MMSTPFNETLGSLVKNDTMTNYYDTPLNDEEFVEIGELLAEIPEPYEPMEADAMDGYLTALLLLPEEPGPSNWMPFVFDAEGRAEAVLPDEKAHRRLEELVYRRYRSLDWDLAHTKMLDPIIYPIEDEKGRPVRGFDSIAAVTPFALGFLEACERFPGLREHDDELVSSALLGIFRHLPEELIGDLAAIKEDLDLESPLENLDQAVDDIAASVAEIASVTRGFALETQEKKPFKKPFNAMNGKHGPNGRPKGPKQTYKRKSY